VTVVTEGYDGGELQFNIRGLKRRNSMIAALSEMIGAAWSPFEEGFSQQQASQA
jgi:hypothetical protein